MAIGFIEVKVKRNTLRTVDSNYKSTFVGEDGYEHNISGNEIIAVPLEIGVAWLSADSLLEQSNKKH